MATVVAAQGYDNDFLSIRSAEAEADADAEADAYYGNMPPLEARDEPLGTLEARIVHDYLSRRALPDLERRATRGKSPNPKVRWSLDTLHFNLDAMC